VTDLKPTIKDIARASGLSYSTVSRALNNHPKIKDSTQKRVLEVAEKMGYRPNLFARSLAKRKTFLIGLIFYDFRNTFYSELTRAIQDAAEKRGYWVVQACHDDDLAKSQALARSMLEIGVEGIIMASALMHDQVIESLLDEGSPPIVLANRRLETAKGDLVGLDNAYGAILLTNHLIHLGYSRIAMVKGLPTASTSVDRYSGYQEAMRNKGLDIDPEWDFSGPFTEKTGYEAVNKLMNLKNRPEAIFCCDDDIAMGCLRGLAELGLRVPEDIAVVGFDDAHISSHPCIQLTTISQDVEQMGRLSAELLVRRIENKDAEPQRVVLEPHLMIRRSCGYQLSQVGR